MILGLVQSILKGIQGLATEEIFTVYDMHEITRLFETQIKISRLV